jgi:hypothetical protein
MALISFKYPSIPMEFSSNAGATNAWARFSLISGGIVWLFTKNWKYAIMPPSVVMGGQFFYGAVMPAFREYITNAEVARSAHPGEVHPVASTAPRRDVRPQGYMTMPERGTEVTIPFDSYVPMVVRGLMMQRE